jgi:hypothetical protein
MNPIDAENYVNGVIQYGCLLTLLYNKKITCHALLESVMKDPVFMDLFMQLTKADDERGAVHGLLHLYPSLIGSKNTTMLIKKLHGTSAGNRKKYI